MVYNSGTITMKKSMIILSVCALLGLCSCTFDAGDPMTKVFDAGETYSVLRVEDAFNVIVSDTATKITLTTGENIMPNVEVKIENNTLTIRLKPSMRIYNNKGSVIIPCNTVLSSVRLSGASEFHSPYPLTGNEVEVVLSGASDCYCDIAASEEVDIDLSGSSNYYGNVTTQNLELEMSGASDAKITGQTTTLEIDASGSSDLVKQIVGDRYGFACNQCTGSLSGSSKAYIHCDGTISVSLSGSSDLYYTGRATTRGCSTSGSSDIVHDAF